MSGFFSGRSGFFTFLLVILVMIVSVAIKFVNVYSLKPATVSGELNEIFSMVENVRPLGLRKAEFLMEWSKYRDSDECSDAVSESRMHEGNGFVGDEYIVCYSDSIEFPGIPTFRCHFHIEKSMSSGR